MVMIIRGSENGYSNCHSTIECIPVIHNMTSVICKDANIDDRNIQSVHPLAKLPDLNQCDQFSNFFYHLRPDNVDKTYQIFGGISVVFLVHHKYTTGHIKHQCLHLS